MSSDPFMINLNRQKSVSVDLDVLFAGNEEAVDIGSMYIGILHMDMKCVEIIGQEPIPYMRQDGLYSNIPVEYDITDAQFDTLINDNPLVVLKIVPKNEMYMINTFTICGDTIMPSIENDDVAQVIAREQLLEQSSNPYLSRFGLSSDSGVNDVPEGVQFIPSNPKRPLLGFGRDPSIQPMIMEPPMCNIATLRQTLQTAFELEWFKLPLYATSFYTLKPTTENKKLREIMYLVFLHQIVRFGQVGNLLTAIGGQPSMVNTTNTPKYPSIGLPGNILNGVYTPLSKFSLDQIASFLNIHQRQNSSQVPLINDLFTVGAFYDEVLNCIDYIGDEVFDYPGQQIAYDLYPAGKLYQVKSMSSAMDAMELIETGDGTAQFRQILEEETGNGPFDQNRVYNMIENPNKYTIFSGTECYDAAMTFNKAVALIIEKLDYAFKVADSKTMNDAVGQMKVTGQLALEIFRVPYEVGIQQLTCGLVWDMDFQQ